jgi:hypothetical protein
LPKEGVFVTVNVTLTYNGTSPLVILTGQSAYLVAADGRRYEPDFNGTFTVDDGLWLDVCYPGQPLTGSFVFDVPDDAWPGAVLSGQDVEVDGPPAVDLALE